MSIYQLIFGTQKHVLKKGQVKFHIFDLNSSRCFLLGGKNIKIEKIQLKKFHTGGSQIGEEGPQFGNFPTIFSERFPKQPGHMGGRFCEY